VRAQKAIADISNRAWAGTLNEAKVPLTVRREGAGPARERQFGLFLVCGAQPVARPDLTLHASEL
jgi:hypothetical protein